MSSLNPESRREHTRPAGASNPIEAAADHRSEAAVFEEERALTSGLEMVADGFAILDADWRFTYVNGTGQKILGRSAVELVGQNHWDLFPATRGTKLEREYRRAVEEQVLVEFENYGSPWEQWLEIKAAPTPKGGLSVSFRDITARKHAEAALTAITRNLAVQVEDLQRLHALYTRLFDAENLGWMLREVLDGVLEMHGTQMGMLSLTHPVDHGLKAAVSRGFSDEFLRLVEYIPAGNGADGACFQEQRPVVVEDVQIDPLYIDFQEVVRIGRFRAVHATPLISRKGKLIGVLSVHFHDPHRPSDREIQLFDLHARQTADLTEMVQLREQTQRELAERRHAEEALHVNEERFRLAAAFSEGITLYEQDGDLRYTWLYPKRSSRDFALGHTDSELLPGEDGELLMRWKHEVMETGVSQRHEARATFPHGTSYYDLFISPRRSAAGEIIGVAGTALDITKRKELEEASQRLAAIVESSDDAIISKDLSGVIKSWNRGAERLFGYTAAEVIGRPITLLIPDDRRDEEIAILTRIRRNEPIDHYETVRRCKNGQVVDVSLTVSPVRDSRGVIVGASKIGRDITQRKREAASRKSEELFRRLADAMPQIVWAAKPDGTVDYYNRRWYEFSGAPEGPDHTLEDWKRVLHPDDVERCVDTYFRCIRNGAPYEIEHRFKDHRTGGYRWFLGRATAVRDETGRVMRWFGTCTDIDDQKRAEERLEAIVAERTARLRDTIADLEAFSYSISHDLRGPLRSMQGFAEILIEDCGPQITPQGRNYLQRINASAERMDRLIQDVLAMSRVGRSDLKLQPVELGKLLQGIMESYPNFQPSQVDITIDAPLPRVFGDVASLTQCLSNLLDNAVKFVAFGRRPKVRIWAEQEHGRVRLNIRDNGIGIRADAHERIFGIFERQSDRYEGTGIGLAIVRKSAERMGGEVGLISAPGEGSTFWVSLQAASSAPSVS